LIFLSYSRRDAAAADRVQAALAASGRTVFRDTDPRQGATPGRLWMQQLYREVRRSEAVVALCSRHSTASRWCIAEITVAHSLDKPIFPVFLDDGPRDAVAELFGGVMLDQLDQLCLALPIRRHDPVPGRAPYPGLSSYKEEDAAVFFGREVDIDRGLAAVSALPLADERLLVIVGPSGSGKSSLARAGVLPALKRDPKRWLVCDPFRPEHDPFGWLVQACPPDLRPKLAPDQSASGLVQLTRRWRETRGAQDAHLVLCVDQLEEVLVESARPAATAFLRALREAFDESGQLLVVATLRSEFLTELHAIASLVGLPYQLLALGGLSAPQVRAMVEGPARISDLDVDDALTEEVVQAVGSADALPLVAQALHGVWSADREQGRLTASTLQRLGGVFGSINSEAERLVARLDDSAIKAVQSAFLLLAQLGPEGGWTRRSLGWAEIPPAAHPTLRRFEQARLIVVDGETVRVAHEALFRKWDRLDALLKKHKHEVDLQGKLLDNAREWEAAGSPTEHPLLSAWAGARLSEARASFQEHVPDLQRRFLEMAEDADLRRLRTDADALSHRLQGARRAVDALLEEEEVVEFASDLSAHHRVLRYDDIARRSREAARMLRELEAAWAQLSQENPGYGRGPGRMSTGDAQT
jgi:hypothetical protein